MTMLGGAAEDTDAERVTIRVKSAFLIVFLLSAFGTMPVTKLGLESNGLNERPFVQEGGVRHEGATISDAFDQFVSERKVTPLSLDILMIS